MRDVARRIRSTDVLITAGFVSAAAAESLIETWGHPIRLIFTLPGALLLGSLWLRRSRPLLTISITAVGAAIGSVAQSHLPAAMQPPANVMVPILALLFMVYSLAVHGSPRAIALGAVQPVLVVVVVDLTTSTGYAVQAAVPFFASFIVAAPLLAGLVVRSRNGLVRRLRQQELDLARESAERAGAARSRERLQLMAGLQITLVSGVERLLAELNTARTAAAEAQGEAIGRLEDRARRLLSETRNVIVDLASAPRASEDGGLAAAQVAENRTRASSAAGGDAIAWAALAAATLCIGLLLERRTSPESDLPRALVMLTCFAAAVPMGLIWYRPLLMTAALWSAAAVFSWRVGPFTSLLTMLVLVLGPAFAVSRLEPRGRATAGLLVCLAGSASCFALDGIPLVIAAWAAGRVVRDRSDLVRALRANNLLLADQRDAAEERAIWDERAQAAHEVHDAVGHSLTVIALQAGAAKRLWPSDPERARAALATIARVATAGLDELRLLGPVSPLLGIEGIGHLAENARAVGVQTEVRIDDQVRRLAADAQFVIYRVVQEALTNVLKHAPGAKAEVTLRRVAGAFELVVTNRDGARASGQPASTGRGLQGMKKRVESQGGQLAWGREEGVFTVRAQFPITR